MKANLANREPEILARWQQLDIYQALRKHCAGRPKFILHDGPPYANGEIHLGTALNKTLKDIVIKSKTLSGYDAPYVPGWDCHGLPIELKVEKKVGKAGAKLSHSEFRQACRDFAGSQVEIQKEAFQRLGVIGEWDNPYLTMNFRYEAGEIRALAKIIEQGHLQRGEKPVHWCTSCGSALAEAEVEYQDKNSPAVDVGFDAVDPAAVAKVFDVAAPSSVTFPIWTTTPWTLPANQAVAVNAELRYSLVSCMLNSKPMHLVLATDLVNDFITRCEIEDHKVLAEVEGAALEQLQLQHPFLDRIVPVVLGDHVTVEAGTGNVHTAPAHGQDDYVVGSKYKLPVNNPVDSRSCFHEDIPFVGGLHVFKANEPIIELLKERGHLLHSVVISHSYPHCWRHKTPLIFRATPQWFISMDKNGLREAGMAAIESVKWIPSWGEQRIGNMIEGRPDWCISRQRTWGVPIALFIHKQSGEMHPDTVALMEKVAQRVEEAGIDAWYDLDPETLLGNDAQDYEKVTDIIDVWFDSGVSHYCVLDARSELSAPADLYLEGSDQYRGWFQSSLLSSLAIRDQAPYKTVLTHGYVVDGKGYKMSKSVGNTVLPREVINRSGADVLRLWVAASDHTNDIGYSDEIMKRISDAYRRIRNTARFLLSNLNDFDPSKDCVADEELLALDVWAIAKTKELQDKIVTAYENYRFPVIYHLIHNFCSVEMGSFYLDIIKDRQYTSQAGGIPRRSAQTAMYHIIEALVRWMAPILTFTAEEIWQFMPGQRAESVFFSAWYDAFPAVINNYQQNDFWIWMMMVRDEVNKVLEAHRKAGDIGSALEANVSLYGEEEHLERLLALDGELRFVLITSGAQVLPLEDAEHAQDTEIPGLKVAVSVSQNHKCERCWQRRPDVGSDPQHATLCGRCVMNINGGGEARKYA